MAFANLQRCQKGEALKPPISPLEGEMSGRTEGGAKERGLSPLPRFAGARNKVRP
ncbi:hypothetical protein MEA186_21666 [Mesorhizobium amorphae CCNWGS0123]|uniref:Propionyl-coenzyme A carboxylase alpha polypeptide n=1 Tax=Mesorhizobium amorphae CCNWGS0123 TaxID=1082933 RepID=G6YEE0_9HYPH|nr:hypothetical protein MEA186_21666 [Mesorhizobium amorphae CCNWGS0123]